MLPGLGDGGITVVVPTALIAELPLLQAEAAEFEAALDRAVRVGTDDPGTGVRWLLETAEVHHPELAWDATRQVIRARAHDAIGLFRTFNLLHPLVRGGGLTVRDVPVTDRLEIFDRVTDEVAGSFPALPQRFDWPAICERHRSDVLRATDLTDALQRFVAELRDVHTWVRSSRPAWNPPYTVSVAGDDAEFWLVPEGTEAHQAGVRAGWTLVDEAVRGGAARSGAPSHSATLIAGRRLIAVDGESRRFRAVSADGREAEWTEHHRVRPIVTRRDLDNGDGYVRISSWTDAAGTDNAIDAALQSFRGRSRLVVDLRGNTGGNLVLALRTRDRFLRERTDLGSIRYSDGRGGVSDPRELVGAPLTDGCRWAGELTVLIDALTCSASEDFLLGLHGLPHVRTVGSTTCGGSGRPRSISLTDDLTLTVSTALTFDRTGRCIEGNGIPADLPASCWIDETPC